MHAKPIAIQDNLQVALDLADLGFKVFPVTPDTKDPLCKWKTEATTDKKKIRAWWKWKPDAMPAFRTGEDFDVLDLDRKDGKDGFKVLEAMGVDPAALSWIIVETPTGGCHLYFQRTPGLRCSVGQEKDGLAGVDVRAERGFVVAPGASNAKGSYQFIKGNLSDLRDGLDFVGMPVWPSDLPMQARVRSGATSGAEPTGLPLAALRDALMVMPIETREAEFGTDLAWFKVARIIVDETGGSEEGNELWHEWSEDWGGYDYHQAEDKWNREDTYDGERATVWTILNVALKAGWTHPDFEAWKVQQDTADFTDDMTTLEEVDPDDDKSDGDLFTMSPDDCANFEPVPYIVKDLIAQRDMVTVVGMPGVGKSVVVPYIAYAVAQGREVFGRRTRQGVVLYLAAENDRDMQKRISALRTVHGPCPDFHMLPDCGGKFRDKDFLRKLRRLIQTLKPSLIVADTLRAALPGIKENDSEGMGQAITTMRSLTKWGAAVLLVDHDNVAGSGLPRGHGSLHGDVDMNLSLKRNEDKTVTGTPTKNRNGPSHESVLAYTIRPVPLDKMDQDGVPLTTVICEESDAPEAKGRRLPRGASAAYVTLHALAKGGKPVAEIDWRDTCVNGRTVSSSEDHKARGRAFLRAKNTLTDEGLIAFHDGHYSLVGIRPVNLADLTDDFPDPEGEP